MRFTIIFVILATSLIYRISSRRPDKLDKENAAYLSIIDPNSDTNSTNKPEVDFENAVFFETSLERKQSTLKALKKQKEKKHTANQRHGKNDSANIQRKEKFILEDKGFKITTERFRASKNHPIPYQSEDTLVPIRDHEDAIERNEPEGSSKKTPIQTDEVLEKKLEAIPIIQELKKMSQTKDLPENAKIFYEGLEKAEIKKQLRMLKDKQEEMIAEEIIHKLRTTTNPKMRAKSGDNDDDDDDDSNDDSDDDDDDDDGAILRYDLKKDDELSI